MSGPIDAAYTALAAKIATALAAAHFIASAAKLEIDPEGPTEIDGDPRHVESVAILLQLQTGAVRTLVGSGTPRFVVERQARLELAIAGPDRADRNARLTDALTGVAPIGITDPTLGGTAERAGITGQEDGDLPPNGRKVFLTFYVRVRAGDPLGLTA